MWSKELREFVSWYNNEFKLTPLYRDMVVIKEDSPYHRENSAAAHTDMVVMTLLGIQKKANLKDSNRNSMNHGRLLALFAAAFHDVGKPAMREEKSSLARGTYYSYNGHELRSARLWQNYYVENKQTMLDRFGMTREDFYKIAVMIEKHRPWNIKDESKIHAIFSALGIEVSTEYINLLYADNSGRIGDDINAFTESVDKIKYYITLLSKHEKYVAENNKKKNDLRKKNNAYWAADTPQLIMPIGQSGAGKSRLFNIIEDNNHKVNPDKLKFERHSMDIIRNKLYGDDDEIAFKKSTDDLMFISHVQKEFIDLIKARKNIYVDNTNLSAKRRRFYISEAMRHGYDCRAVLFVLSLDDAVNRNKQRTNKKPIPSSSVINQYMAMSMPLLHSEFDSIVTVK